MQFIKRLLVLKKTQDSPQKNKPLSALLRLEIESGIAELHFSVVNLYTQPHSNYFLLVVDGNGKHYEFDLGPSPTSFSTTLLKEPCVDKGFSAGFYIVKDNLPLTLAFGCENGINIEKFKKVLAEKYLMRHKECLRQDKPKEFEKAPVCEQESLITDQYEGVQPSQYNDEAVATVDYYALDDHIKEKINLIRGMQDERSRTENELFDNDCKSQKEKNSTFYNLVKDETNANLRKEKANDFPYLKKVQKELDAIFLSYPEEENLTKLFLGSKWSKIYYKQDKFYVVGLITLDCNQQYICYGIPATYSNLPPEPLKDCAQFIPKSIFNMHGEGYWIMFQDAYTGKCVFLN